jgi:hypothetical protein
MNVQQENALGRQTARWDHPLKFHLTDFKFQLIKEEIALILLFLYAIVATYYVPSGFSKILFLALPALFWFSKKDYFWFAFFFVIIQEPGWLFSGSAREALHRLPLYTFLPGMALSVVDIFVVLALIKALVSGKKSKLELKKPITILLVYVIFSFLMSVLKGAPLDILTGLGRGPFYYTVIISFFYLIKNKREAYSFIALVSPFVFFVLFTQLYLIATGSEFINLLAPGMRESVVTADLIKIRATAGGALLIFLCYMFSLFLMEDKGNRISKKYLCAIISVTFLTVVFSATRLWFALFLFIFAGYMILSKKRARNLITMASISLVLIGILVFSGILRPQFLTRSVFPRLGEIGAVAKGDFESVDTFSNRYYFRLPRLLVGVKQNLLLGSGFTPTYFDYYDYHVGFFNTILQFGILGFSLFIYFFWSYFDLIKKTVKRLSPHNSLRRSLRFLAVTFGGILFGNFFTWYFFPMDGNTYISYFIAIYLGLTEVFIREAKTEELPSRPGMVVSGSVG